ncbi:MAG: hypothetical protein BWY27_00809 [Bacteroidetes bacterium ADurb.Bin234]|jgi:nucleoid DNA-binding protein|nr:MAG: hypothetical protein BWY27_00809 [Bacteroidetes bacterium ADurb.Bin234]
MSTKHLNLKLNSIPLQERYPDSAETEACKMISKIELFYKIQEDTGLAIEKIQEVIESMYRHIEAELIEEKPVEVPYFGLFYILDRKVKTLCGRDMHLAEIERQSLAFEINPDFSEKFESVGRLPIVFDE